MPKTQKEDFRVSKKTTRGLSKQMTEATDQSQSWLALIQETFDEFHRIKEEQPYLPKTAADEFIVKLKERLAAIGIENPEITLLNEVLEKGGQQIIFSNNLVFKIANQGQNYIVKLETARSSSNVALERLEVDGVPPPWLTDTFVEVNQQAPHDDFNDPDGYDFDTSRTESIKIQEACTPLSARLEEIHREDNQNKEDEITTLAVRVGSQLSGLLGDISKQNVIWTDLKPGNILLRKDPIHMVAISDTKAFRPVEQLFTETKVDENGVSSLVVKHEDTTGAYISAKARIDCSPEETIQEWNKEYSYQIAVVLYRIATNETKTTDQKFDFDETKHPYFASEEGKRLKYLIEALSHPEPDQRMKHGDAQELLQRLHNPKLFDERRVQLEKQYNPAQVALNELRKGNIQGFLDFFNSYPQSDKFYNERFTQLFIKSNFDLHDIKMLINFRLALEDLPPDVGDRDRMLHSIINVSETLLSIYALKDVIPADDLAKIQSSNLLGNTEQTLDDIAKILNTELREEVAKQSDKICLAEMSNAFKEEVDSKGMIGVRDDFDNYKKTKEFYNFKQTFKEHLKPHMTPDEKKEFKENNYLNTALLHPERFSFKNNVKKAIIHHVGIRGIPIEKIADFIKQHPETADIFLKKRGANPFVRNYRDELKQAGLLEDLLQIPAVVKSQEKTLSRSQEMSMWDKATTKQKSEMESLREFINSYKNEVGACTEISKIDIVTRNMDKNPTKLKTPMSLEDQIETVKSKAEKCVDRANVIIQRINNAYDDGKINKELRDTWLQEVKSLQTLAKGQVENPEPGHKLIKDEPEPTVSNSPLKI